MTVILRGITAIAHPDGNRIDLSWSYPEPDLNPEPDPAQRPAVRVVRREGGHPTDPDDGVVVADEPVADEPGRTAVRDTGLRGETVYYYGLFPHTGTPPVYDTHPDNRASATALSPYGFAGMLYELLPAIYRRYDAARLPAPGRVPPADAEGQLRRFLDLPGGELDRLYSLARTLLGATDVDRVDAALLPLLGDWIGWRTDFGLPGPAQRTEIRHAPHVYRSVGGLDTVDATVLRVTGWTHRTKEYVHNVARTNRPERLNLWSVTRDQAGTVTEPQLASVNFAYDGQPTLAVDADGSVFAAYHTQRHHGWDIWAKRYTVDKGWEASAPIVNRPGIDKHPSAARTSSRLWLFWQGYDPSEAPQRRRWRIWFATRTGTTWSQPQLFGDPDTERQLPAAASDGPDGLWLFWRERVGNTWRVRYNRHDGQDWQLAVPQTFPLDNGQDPQVEDDLHVLVRPGAGAAPLWVFWSRAEPGGPPGQTRRGIAYRIKTGPDPTVSDWTVVRRLPKSGDGAYHDRHPYPLAGPGGAVELVWGTTSGGGPTVVRNTVDPGTFTWGTARTLGDGPYAARGPAAVRLGDGRTVVLYRANRSIVHARGTVDERFAGTATVDARWKAKLELRGTADDFQTYLNDAGPGRERTDEDRVARDTVGLFLQPDTADPERVRAAVDRLAETLHEFLPVTARAVLITP